MKKSIGILLMLVFLAVPFIANAGIIDTVNLKEGSGSTWGNFTFPNLGTVNVIDTYYATISGATNIQNGTFDAFCVEDAWYYSNSTGYTYTILSLDSSLGNYTDLFTKYLQASWIADNYYTDDKQAAQIAIWELMFETDSSYSLISGAFRNNTYNDSVTDTTLSHAATYLDNMVNAGINWSIYSNSNWVLAVNPVLSADNNFTISLNSQQNYLVHSSPVPEPATMLLFGTGLVGLAGFGRWKLNKKVKKA